jgi:hypothetical protein
VALAGNASEERVAEFRSNLAQALGEIRFTVTAQGGVIGDKLHAALGATQMKCAYSVMKACSFCGHWL